MKNNGCNATPDNNLLARLYIDLCYQIIGQATYDTVGVNDTVANFTGTLRWSSSFLFLRRGPSRGTPPGLTQTLSMLFIHLRSIFNYAVPIINRRARHHIWWRASVEPLTHFVKFSLIPILQTNGWPLSGIADPGRSHRRMASREQ